MAICHTVSTFVNFTHVTNLNMRFKPNYYICNHNKIAVMEISERIAKIIASEGLTASAFADKIGIQRSNISHIMNGRSGPSLDLLQKILNSFPHYNTDWLVMGKGEIYRQPVQTTIFDILGDDGGPVVPQPDLTAQNAAETASNDIQNASVSANPSMPQHPQLFETEPVVDNKQPSAAKTEQDAPAADLTSVLAHAAQHQAEVKQVVVLYTDNTFIVYNKQ